MSTPRDPFASLAEGEIPPFLPDPELIEHAEGNVRERERYRNHARRSLTESMARWRATHPDEDLTLTPDPDPPPSQADPDLIEWERRTRDPG